MSAVDVLGSVEREAISFLLDNSPIAGYQFTKKANPGDVGYDLLCSRVGCRRKFRVEVKGTRMRYSPRRPSDIRKQLYFSREHEIALFEEGKSKVVRVFLGNQPPHVAMFDISIQGVMSKLKIEPRAMLNGRLNYNRVTHLTRHKSSELNVPVGRDRRPFAPE